MSTATLTEATPAITWLNMSGDITITWDKTNEAAMLALIEQKMKLNFRFFIIQPRLLGLLGSKKVLATDIEAIRKAGSVVADENALLSAKLHDTDVERVVNSGQADLVKPSTTEKTALRAAKTAQEVLQHQTVAVRPVVGG